MLKIVPRNHSSFVTQAATHQVLSLKKRTVGTVQVLNGTLLKKLCASFKNTTSGCGAAGSALPWGGRGRKFKSCHSDQVNGGCKSSVYLYFTRVFRTFGCGIFYIVLRKKCSENSEKSSWYIIWYIGSNGAFHRSVEATA